MKSSATVLQLIGFLIGVVGIFAALSAFSSFYGGGSGITILIGSLSAGALFHSLGQALSRLDDIAVDAHRTAAALDVLVKDKTGVGTIPEDLPAPSKIHSIAPRQSNVNKLLGRRS
jgi:hypothetical protein